jgi:hypothetical protein
MVRGPNGNMYNPNELPSNLRMAKPPMPRRATAAEFENQRVAPFSRAVFADDYALKPSDFGYASNEMGMSPPPLGLTNNRGYGNGAPSINDGYIGIQGGFDDYGNINGSRAARDMIMQQRGAMPNPNQINNNPLTLPTAPSTGPSNTAAYGGLALGGLLSGDLTGALQGAAGYYAGQEGIEGALGAGTAGFNLSEQLGQRASDATQFKPFGVTSSLANVQAGANGGLNVNLSPQQQALQGQLMGGAGQLAGNLGGQYNQVAGQIGSNAYGQAQNFLGRAGQFDPSIAGQRGAMGGLFGQQQAEYGQPTGMEGITQAGLSGALGQLGAAGQPADLQSLRSQYGNLAQQAGQGLMMSPEQRQGDIYESIRATQRPEEQRQNLALEERLLGQGRLGISTDAYGGTPEQLAMAKAQAEAGNSASLMARQQAMAEGQQAMQNAQSLTGMTADLAQVGSGLETEGISRGTTLANLGMTGTQASNQMNQQQLQNLMALQGADQSAAGVQQQLQQGNFNLGQGMFGLGNQASMLRGQLQGQDLQNMQAMMASGYQPQQQALNMFGSGLSAAELAQRGQQRGAELQAIAGGQGVESYMSGANMANLLQQQQMQGLMSSAFGQAPTMQEQLINRFLNPDGGMLTNEGGLVNQGLDWVADKFGGLFGGSSPSNYGGQPVTSTNINASKVGTGSGLPAGYGTDYSNYA